jgi:hypothetical protein
VRVPPAADRHPPPLKRREIFHPAPLHRPLEDASNRSLAISLAHLAVRLYDHGSSSSPPPRHLIVGSPRILILGGLIYSRLPQSLRSPANIPLLPCNFATRSRSLLSTHEIFNIPERCPPAPPAQHGFHASLHYITRLIRTTTKQSFNNHNIAQFKTYLWQVYVKSLLAKIISNVTLTLSVQYMPYFYIPMLFISSYNYQPFKASSKSIAHDRELLYFPNKRSFLMLPTAK